jgi:hypothetical protein
MSKSDHSESPENQPDPGSIVAAALERLRHAEARHASALANLQREAVACCAARERLDRALESAAARLAVVTAKLRHAFSDDRQPHTLH